LRPRSGLALVLALGLIAAPAAAVIPDAQKIADAVARTNRAEGRTGPLLFDVTLRIGDSAPLARGVLATHPTGLARLELRSNQGFVERHLLQGNDYRASRDGELLRSPRPFLPPLFLLQAISGAALRAALSSFGVLAGEVVLGLADDRDCYVLGGRLPGATAREERRLPSLWIDMETYGVVRVDRQDGVRFRFGPAGSFDGIRAPSWIAIEVPGQRPARLDVMRVAPANAPAASFGVDWLAAPLAAP
jgi:hypothetical protein